MAAVAHLDAHAERPQVSVNSAEVALRAAALSYIATSAYRRTPCKPSIY